MDTNGIEYILDLISKEESYYRQFVTAYRRYNITDELIEEYIKGHQHLIQVLKNIANLLSL